MISTTIEISEIEIPDPVLNSDLFNQTDSTQPIAITITPLTIITAPNDRSRQPFSPKIQTPNPTLNNELIRFTAIT